MKAIVLGFLLGISGIVAMAGSKPKLVVGITISQFYPEWLTVYENELSEGGFRRIMNEGKSFMADYNYIFSQTGVDQATIYTGLLPSEHGVISHAWFDRLRNRRQSNVVAQDYRLIGEEGDEKI